MKSRSEKKAVYEKYWGHKAYMDVEKKLYSRNMQKAFSKEEKLQVLSNIVEYIEANDIDHYHGFMDTICVEETDWFNLLIFDRKAKETIKDYIKYRTHSKKKGCSLVETLIISEDCIVDEEPLERNCHTCEFFGGDKCIGAGLRLDNGEYTSGMPIEEALEMFPNGCNDYGISLYAFIELEERAGR